MTPLSVFQKVFTFFYTFFMHRSRNSGAMTEEQKAYYEIRNDDQPTPLV